MSSPGEVRPRFQDGTAIAIVWRAAVLLALSFMQSCRTQVSPAVGAEQQARAAGVAVAATSASPDTAAAVRQQVARQLLAELGPRATMPAESVFTNVRILRGMSAGQVVRIMDGGFGRALGVTCAHCHEQGDWASDAKPPKRIARGMWAMDRIASQELRAIPDVSPQAVVNCTTCHGGRVKPISNLP